MNSLGNYYVEKLYPLQDGVMKIVKDLQLPFYLTGGTALSRFYYHHRYSDDLDYFVNNDPRFKSYQSAIIESLNSKQSLMRFKVLTDRIVISNDYLQVYIASEEIELKIDFVNDILARFGELVDKEIYGKIDNVRNILSNKISALYRFEVKDYVDIWMICKNYSFNWRDLISEAKQKEVSVDPLEIYNLFKSFPFENLNIVKWAIDVDTDQMKKEFEIIAEDIINRNDNTLHM